MFRNTRVKLYLVVFGAAVLVIIERHKQDENTERMDRILLESGFKYYGKVGINLVWVNPKNARPADSNDSLYQKSSPVAIDI